ncbi:Hypothetical predicted protein [Xyrichtys novacula]|uniref:Uncharacterized protein n=1 Tax=Xyrichtys novacula TaxID=13765 RepID=A0AAV1G4U8_XYRNO|nr:Hypothetical predicted protein [Xyrichtys novacula]
MGIYLTAGRPSVRWRLSRASFCEVPVRAETRPPSEETLLLFTSPEGLSCCRLLSASDVHANGFHPSCLCGPYCPELKHNESRRDLLHSSEDLSVLSAEFMLCVIKMRFKAGMMSL